MNIALFCVEVCPHSKRILEYLKNKNVDISLVLIEKVNRTKFSKNEMDNREALRKYILYKSIQYMKTKSIFLFLKHDLLQQINWLLRIIWWRMPTVIRKIVKSMSCYLPCINKFSMKNISKETRTPYVYVDIHSSEETVAILRKAQIDYVLLGSTGWLLKDPLFSLETTRIISCHSSKLPLSRGLDAALWSIRNQDPVGVTAFFIDKGLDTGDILFFRDYGYNNDDTILSVRDKLEVVVPEVLFSAICGLKAGTIIPTPQNEEYASYNPPMSFKELVETDKIFSKMNIINNNL